MKGDVDEAKMLKSDVDGAKILKKCEAEEGRGC